MVWRSTVEALRRAATTRLRRLLQSACGPSQYEPADVADWSTTPAELWYQIITGRSTPTAAAAPSAMPPPHGGIMIIGRRADMQAAAAFWAVDAAAAATCSCSSHLLGRPALAYDVVPNDVRLLLLLVSAAMKASTSHLRSFVHRKQHTLRIFFL